MHFVQPAKVPDDLLLNAVDLDRLDGVKHVVQGTGCSRAIA